MNILQIVATGEFAKDKFVEFVVRSDDLDPQKLSSELQITPSRTFAKGDKHVRPYRDPRTGAMQEEIYEKPWGIWVVDSKAVAVTETLESHVRYLLDKLEPGKEQIKRYLREEARYAIFFYIWWRPDEGGGSYLISSATVHQMSELCNYVEFAFLA